MDQATQTKSITIVVDAFSTNEYDDGPAYAAFVVNHQFLERINAVLSVGKQLDLSQAALIAHPEKWGQGDIEDTLRLQSCQLIIDMYGTSYFEAQPKYGAVIQSRGQHLSHLFEVFAEANDGDIVYLGEKPDDLKEMYLEDLEVPA